jgi:hypothetical protein
LFDDIEMFAQVSTRPLPQVLLRPEFLLDFFVLNFGQDFYELLNLCVIIDEMSVQGEKFVFGSEKDCFVDFSIMRV